ncbi:type II and III secretion system protein [Geobacter metallireducens RCH3]|uniref:secretin and TonB N-terminal domain-containing protein n=1 Tax=Geobacter metallireducens TaxID=28232 RepID=UPI00024A4564|nr:secretin and TonB N-terminal domain-containing protein [Geobacter metallireducens]EHP88725.1 type II and III secretion system protein [Geobacter metallireducens RCH3]
MRIIFKIIAFLSFFAFLSGCGAGLTAFSKGERLEREGKLDEAVIKYSEAVASNPEMNEYRMRLLKTSEEAALRHLSKGDEFIALKNYDAALVEYQAAVALDPSLQRAKQESDKLVRQKNSRTYFKEGQDFERGNKPREALQAYRKALDLDGQNKEAKEALERLLSTKKTRLEGYELNLKSTKPITLKFKDANLKDVFYIVTQLSGINFIFDDTIKDQKVTIYLENANFQQALDLLTNMNKLGKKVLNESTILIFPKTPEKSKQYEDLVVKTFFLNTLDAKKAVNLLRTMLQVRKVYVNEELNAIVVRDTSELVDVAGKILEANDVPDAEVLLDVEVIEVSKRNIENFGLALSKYAVSLNTQTPGGGVLNDTFSRASVSSSTGTTIQGTAGSELLQTFSWNGYSGFMTVPSASYSFGKSITNAEVLANPKIRVKNREKSKFTVGTRVPITTTSTTGTTGGFSVNVQYVDVGVKLNAEPTIMLNNEVSIKLGLEVSSIIDKQTVGGTDSATTVVTIGTRNLDTVLNLKDGETSVIGGLIEDNKQKGKQKIFLLGDIPIIGPLLSNNSNDNQKRELILAITPRLVRSVTVPEPDLVSFWSGKEDDPSVVKPFASFELEPEFAIGQPKTVKQPAASPAPVPASVSAPAQRVAPLQPVPGSPAPTAAPQTTTSPEVKQSAAPAPGQQPAPPSTAQSQAVAPLPVPASPAAPAATVAAASAVPVAAAPAPAVRGSLNISAPAAVNLGSQFKVEIRVSDVKGLLKAPFVLIYDPIFIDYVGAVEGTFLNRDGKPTSFNAQVDKAKGRVTITLARTGAEGIDGAGSLLTATFTAKNKGPASLGLQSVNFTDQANKPIDVVPYNTVVEVK